MKHHNDSPPDHERTELERQVKSLRRDILQLQLEHDILKKANELLKKALGVDLPLPSNQEKTRLVDALRDAYALPELFAELDLARTVPTFIIGHGYGSPTSIRMCVLPSRMPSNAIPRCYGYRRLRTALGRQNFSLSEKVVRRLMRQECLVAAATKRRRYGSCLGKISPAPENLINRDFQAATPNEKWLTDITQVPDRGWQGIFIAHDRLLRWASCQLDSRHTS